MNVYKSNAITSLVVNPGTKVGVNIRVSSLFTQSIKTDKVLECKINSSLLDNAVGNIGNDSWSGTFEVVEASRFDLALSKSIAAISKNLEAAEGAT
jgi:hypothetical protein